MKSSNFIIGYTLPLLPLAVLQILVCFAVALVLGLGLTFDILLTILVTIPAAILFIGIGLLCGSLFNDKQVGGVCGALLTNLSAWLQAHGSMWKWWAAHLKQSPTSFPLSMQSMPDVTPWQENTAK